MWVWMGNKHFTLYVINVYVCVCECVCMCDRKRLNPYTCICKWDWKCPPYYKLDCVLVNLIFASSCKTNNIKYLRDKGVMNNHIISPCKPVGLQICTLQLLIILATLAISTLYRLYSLIGNLDWFLKICVTDRIVLLLHY